MKKFQDEIVHQKTFSKKAPYSVGASCGRYQDIRHILQNPKLPGNTKGFNNHNLFHKTMKHRALGKNAQQLPSMLSNLFKKIQTQTLEGSQKNPN